MKLTNEEKAVHFAIAQSCWPDELFECAEKAYLAGIRAGLERAAKAIDYESGQGCAGCVAAIRALITPAP